jgi:uncharacterized protein (TIGR02444 family)
MARSRPEIEAESWAFALEIYARPGVAEACLALQNNAGVDVMILLTVTFAAIRHRKLLTADEIKALDEACHPWREQIVWPLRNIRSRLKTGPAPAPSKEAEQFRSKIKAVELDAERLQNQLLAECLPLGPPGKQPTTPARLRDVLGKVVALYAERRGEEVTGRLALSIDEIVKAAIQDAS